jgi:hypothetical protein
MRYKIDLNDIQNKEIGKLFNNWVFDNIKSIELWDDNIIIIYEATIALPYEEDTYHLGPMERKTIINKYNHNKELYIPIFNWIQSCIRNYKLEDLGI